MASGPQPYFESMGDVTIVGSRLLVGNIAAGQLKVFAVDPLVARLLPPSKPPSLAGLREIVIGDSQAVTGALVLERERRLVWIFPPQLVVLEPGTLAVSGFVTVGDRGNGSVTVTDGGQLSSLLLTIARGPQGSSGSVRVRGGGSAWYCSGNGSLQIGGGGGTGTLVIDGGGNVAGFLSNVIGGPGSTAAVTVSGWGSQWTAPGLEIGSGGPGTLNVLNGGRLSSDATRVGLASSGRVAVGGLSTWLNSGQMTIGDTAGGTGAVRISGGQVLTDSMTMGAIGGTSGTVEVSGRRSALNVNNGLRVGDNGAGQITIRNSGKVSAEAVLGSRPGGSGAAIVTNRSQWNGGLVVGDDGTGALTISGGGGVVGRFGHIGLGSGSGTVTVTDWGSIWRTNYLSVDKGTLAIVDDAAVVTTEFAGIGGPEGASGSVEITAARWNCGALYIGSLGSGKLNVSFGQVASGGATIGYGTRSSGAATVADDSDWDISPALGVGVGPGATGNLVITHGRVTVTPAVGYYYDAIGYSPGASGTVTVAGPHSVLNLGEVQMAASGIGTLAIADGGCVTLRSLSAGYGASGIGTVSVSGPGSMLDCQGDIHLGSSGGAGGTAELRISNGARIKARTVEVNQGCSIYGSTAIQGSIINNGGAVYP